MQTVKRKKKSVKKSKGFTYFMLSYAAIWIVVTIAVCILLWKGLSGYQKDYDAAKVAGNPVLAMEEAMELFTGDNIEKLVREFNPSIGSRFETIDDYIDFYKNYVVGKDISFVENEKMSNPARPVYDVYTDDYLFAIVSFKAAGEKDSFGFNKWVVKDVVISENNYEYKDVYLKVMDDMKVFINGILVEESELVREDVIENELSDVVSTLTDKKFAYKVYYAGDMIAEPNVLVLDKDGNDITDQYIEKDNSLKDYEATASEEFVDGVEDFVKSFCENYVYHIYRKASADSVAINMEDGSQAEKLLWNAQSTLAWAWVPDTVEILSESYTDFMYYNEKYFSCKSTIMIRKSDSKTVEDEKFECQWLFKMVDGRWQVTYFVIV